MADIPLLQIVNTIADLRALQLTTVDQHVLVVGKDNVDDGKGGFYRWKASETAAEDTEFMNTIVSNLSTTGRWVRTFQRVKKYASNIMVMNGGVKSLYCPSITNASGKATVYPTDTGAAVGNALFTEVWQLNGTVNAAAADAGSVMNGSGNISSDLKTVNYTFAKSNTTTLGGSLAALLGAIIPGLRSVEAGVPVYVVITGV